MAHRQQAVEQQDSCGDLKNSQKSQITDDHPQAVRRTATAVDVQLCDCNDYPRIIFHAVCLIVADLKGAEKKKKDRSVGMCRYEVIGLGHATPGHTH